MAEGISFTGDGAKDVSINITNTGNGDAGKGGSKAIEFAGNGADDVTHSLSTNNGSRSMPSGGQIEFAGDN